MSMENGEEAELERRRAREKERMSEGENQRRRGEKKERRRDDDGGSEGEWCTFSPYTVNAHDERRNATQSRRPMKQDTVVETSDCKCTAWHSNHVKHVRSVLDDYVHTCVVCVVCVV